MVFPETTQIPPVPLIINLTGVKSKTLAKLNEYQKSHHILANFSRYNVMAFWYQNVDNNTSFFEMEETKR
ncbi:hypothetical protein EFE13_01810 [Leuconostoc pseudomesenteroides]|nr:hypothetical protein [Leuconostoc pseudomesenteroides]MCT4401621.1 hypothetical protein [Leuconostoc suionicum]